MRQPSRRLLITAMTLIALFVVSQSRATVIDDFSEVLPEAITTDIVAPGIEQNIFYGANVGPNTVDGFGRRIIRVSLNSSASDNDSEQLIVNLDQGRLEFSIQSGLSAAGGFLSIQWGGFDTNALGLELSELHTLSFDLVSATASYQLPQFSLRLYDIADNYVDYTFNLTGTGDLSAASVAISLNGVGSGPIDNLTRNFVYADDQNEVFNFANINQIVFEANFTGVFSSVIQFDNFQVIPEPSSLALLGCLTGAVFAYRRRKRLVSVAG